MAIIPIKQGHCGLYVTCRCNAKDKHQAEDNKDTYYGEDGHHCFFVGSPRLRGFCPPCFEAQMMLPVMLEYQALRSAYHAEMTRINGFRIKNERSFDRAMTNVVWDEKEGMWLGGPAREPGGPVPRPIMKRISEGDLV